MPRIFTALEVPFDSRHQLAAMRGGLPGARWIDPENYHITLRFIGDIDDATGNDIADMLGRVRRSGFELRFNGLHAFGGRKPRAIVAAVVPSQPLLELQADLERLIKRLGLEPEGRKFTPHVTLARLRDVSSHDVADYLSTRVLLGALPFRASRFVLYSSRNSFGGGPYLVEAAYPLREEAVLMRPPAP